jgi:hypothetical protein
VVRPSYDVQPFICERIVNERRGITGPRQDCRSGCCAAGKTRLPPPGRLPTTAERSVDEVGHPAAHRLSCLRSFFSQFSSSEASLLTHRHRPV